MLRLLLSALMKLAAGGIERSLATVTSTRATLGVKIKHDPPDWLNSNRPLINSPRQSRCAFLALAVAIYEMIRDITRQQRELH